MKYELIRGHKVFPKREVQKLAMTHRGRYIRSLKDLINDLYVKKKWSIVKTADLIGIGHTTLRANLRRWGWLEKRGLAAQAEKVSKHKDWIIKCYSAKDRKSLVYIGRKIGVDPVTISNALKRWKVPLRGPFKPKTQVIMKNRMKIIDLYMHEGWTATQIAKKFGIAECTVNLRLKEWGIPAKDYTKAKPEDVKHYYDVGFTPEEIAKKLNVMPGSIYKILVNKFGIHHSKKRKFTIKEDRRIKYLYGVRGLPVPQVLRILHRSISSKNITDIVLRRRIEEIRLTQGSVSELDDTELFKLLGLVGKGWKMQKIADTMELPINFVIQQLEKWSFTKYKRSKDLPDEVKKQIVELRKKGISYKLIALTTQTTPTIVFDYLKPMNIEAGKVREYRKESLDEMARIIRSMRKHPEMTLQRISKEIGISIATVTRIIRDYKIPKVNKVFTEAVKERIRTLHFSGKHYKEIAEEMDLKVDSVRQAVRDMGLLLKFKPYGVAYSKKAVKTQKKIIRKYYLPPYMFSVKVIAAKLGIDHTTVRNRLKAMKIQMRSAEEAREVRRTRTAQRIWISEEDKNIIHEKRRPRL